MKPISAARIVATAIAPCGVAICAYVYAIRPWHLRWGATTAEIERTWPGDGEVSHPKLAATRAVMIKAPPEDVWPWLVQMGKGRAGFYSYTWIEHLMGLEIENTDRILPEFQQLKAGDRIPDLGPVTALEPNHFLLLSGHEPWGDLSWLLALEPMGARQTRLISRSRYNLRWGRLLRTLPLRLAPFYVLFEPGEFVMLRKMLLGIKSRAQKRAKMLQAAVKAPANSATR